jgi:hypothetical protein
MATPIELFSAALDAVKGPTDATVAALAEVLADDVVAAGLFVSGRGREAVLAAVRTQAIPALAIASWGEAEVDGGEVKAFGALPPGHQLSGVTLAVRHDDGLIRALVQEPKLAPPPPAAPLRIDDTIAATINGAFDQQAPFVVAYVGLDALPHVSYRGSVQVFADDALAMWARDPNGGLVKSVGVNPALALMYRDPKTRTQYEFVGRARVDNAPEVRDTVFAHMAPFEQGLDPARRGVAIIVELDSITGGPPGAAVNMRQEVSS